MCRGSLDRGHAPRRLGITRRDAIPDSPDVFPTFPPHTVEKSDLQIVGLGAGPAIGDIRHVARFEPFEAIDFWHKLRILCRVLLPPGHDVPRQGFIAGRQFRLKGKRMTREIGCLREGKRYPILSVAINAVGTNFRHPLGNRLGPWFTRIAGTLIPHHHGKQDPNTVLMKGRDHLPDPVKTAGHRGNRIELVTIIDSNVGIDRPQENGVYAAIALIDIGQIPINGIFASVGS